MRVVFKAKTKQSSDNPIRISLTEQEAIRRHKNDRRYQFLEHSIDVLADFMVVHKARLE